MGPNWALFHSDGFGLLIHRFTSNSPSEEELGLEVLLVYSSSPTATTSTSLLGGFSSKKDLCCSLFDKPIIIDGGSKSFGLEKRSGNICFMLGAKELSIIWGSTPKYWTWRPDNESRYPEVAELLDVCWMEITGKVETRILSPKTMYGAYFVIKIAEQNYGLDRYPGQFSMRFVGGEWSEARRVFLKRENMQQQGEFPRERRDGWMEIEMGEFYNDGDEDEEVEMHLLETSGHWKRGLIVQGMEFRPKGFMLGARELSISWGSTPTYWTWRPDNESRFPEVAELLAVCWLEITGKVETRMLSPKTMYGAYFVIKTAEQNYGLDRYPGQFSMRFVGGEWSEARRVFLKRENMQQQGEFPRERWDGWMEIEMGEFYNDGEEDEEVEMHLLETSGHWKRGLIVQGMEFRPKVST